MPKARVPGLPSARGLNKAAADRVVGCINSLRHQSGKGAGQPFDLRPWQTAIIRELFGRLRPDGTRQYRTCYLELPRKNGKTELAAAIGTYMLLGDSEQAGQVYCAAADRDQASLVYTAAVHMVESHPRLNAECKIIRSTKRIVHYATASFLRAISAEAYSKHGFNASAIIYDELHAAPNRELWDVLTTSTGARRQPLTVVITTAGWDRQSICWELHEYATRVRDGIVDDPTFLPVIYAAPEDADWTSEAVWRACNPALGDFRSLDELRQKVTVAQRIPAQQNSVRRLYLNQWTEQYDRWIDMARWRACAMAVPLEELEGAPCYAGLDLGQNDDLTAFVLIWDLGDRIACRARFWLPEGALATYHQRPYRLWRESGHLEVTPGDVTDLDVVEAAVRDECQRWAPRQVAYDKRFAEQLRLHLEGYGIAMINTEQGFGLHEALTKLSSLVAEGALCHGDQPILTWMASNAVVKHGPHQTIRLDKQKAGDKIDGIAALTMALDCLIKAGEPSRLVYSDRGILTV